MGNKRGIRKIKSAITDEYYGSAEATVIGKDNVKSKMRSNNHSMLFESSPSEGTKDPASGTKKSN